LLAGTPALEGRITRRLDRITPIAADVLVIDAPPGFSPIAQTAVAIADVVLVPIIAEPLATRTIEHVVGLLDGLDARSKLAGVVVTMYEPRRTITGAQVAAIEALGVAILGYIPRLVAVVEAALVGKSIVSYAPRSPAAAAYRALASSVLALGRAHATV
jgi:chromosome partitioning protein